VQSREEQEHRAEMDAMQKELHAGRIRLSAVTASLQAAEETTQQQLDRAMAEARRAHCRLLSTACVRVA
jgi:hypothetical protein